MVIGWDFGEDCLTEDIKFGLLAWERGFTCDRIDGEVNEISPFTLGAAYFVHSRSATTLNLQATWRISERDG